MPFTMEETNKFFYGEKYGLNSYFSPNLAKQDEVLNREIDCLKKLILEMKKIEDDEIMFTISYCSSIPPNRAKRILKYNSKVNIYEVEIADDDSITEYYFLDINAFEDLADDVDENTFRLFLLGEISPLEVRKLCKLPDDI